MLGAFAGHVASHGAAHLLLVGPSTAAVADDPEGAQVLDAVRAAWHDLPAAIRRRVHLCSLPMDDVEENAAIVNALQRHADVVVQKSLAEGFGLTVAEAMWKQRPVVASRIGGIRDQIEDGRSGVLLSDPRDLRTGWGGDNRAAGGRRSRARNRHRGPAPRPAAVPRSAPPWSLLRGDPQGQLTERAGPAQPGASDERLASGG